MLRPLIRPIVRPLVRGVTEPGYGSLAAQIRLLFASGEQGAWYDPSDLSTLYQDSAGTTPVTALGQPVGLMLDKSGRGNHASQLTDTARPTVQARVNLLTATEDFTSAPWVKETGVTALSANTVSFPAGSDVANRLRQAVEVPQRSIGSWSLTLDVPPVSAWSDPTATLYLTTATGGLGRATTVNATNEWQRVTMVEPPPPTGTFINYMVYADKPVTITGLSKTQLELGSTPTTYQRVTSATDYADVGAKRKIDFDAVDDYLRTVFPDLGADVTIARSIPGTGAQILTGQTIGAGNWDDSTDSHALIVIERALTAPETAMLTRYLNLRAGVTL